MLDTVLSWGSTAIWLLLMVVFLVIEGAAPGLVSIWFAVGSLAGMLASVFSAPVWLQILWFVIVSAAALAATRPLAKKYVNSRKQPTNADVLLGKECVVTEKIDNFAGKGAVRVNGKTWSARMETETETAEVGEHLQILRIEGVKLILKHL